MRIAYCGYDFFSACLQQLIDDGHEIIQAFTFDCDNHFNFNQYVDEICRTHQIPITAAAINSHDINRLEQQNCDLIITAGYRYKVPDLSASSVKGFNIHPSLLPVGRGVWPLPWTILTNQQKSGISIHKISNQFDAGDILVQHAFRLDNDEHLESLSCKHQMIAPKILRELMQDFEAKWESATPQPNSNMSYWSMPAKEDRTLDWTKDVEVLQRTVRAFGKSGTIANFDNNWWYVYDAKAWQEPHQYTLGSVIHKTNTEMVVAVNGGYLCMRYFEPIRD